MLAVAQCRPRQALDLPVVFRQLDAQTGDLAFTSFFKFCGLPSPLLGIISVKFIQILTTEDHLNLVAPQYQAQMPVLFIRLWTWRMYAAFLFSSEI